MTHRRLALFALIAVAGCRPEEDNADFGECYHRTGPDICMACCRSSFNEGRSPT